MNEAFARLCATTMPKKESARFWEKEPRNGH